MFTTYAFPDDNQAFMARFAGALARLGTDVCVVASAGNRGACAPRGDPVLVPRVLRAPWTDPRTTKALTLLLSTRRAAQYHPTEYRRLVSALRRRHGQSRALLAELYAQTPVLSQPFDVLHVGWLEAATHWTELLGAVDAPVVVSCHGSDLRLEPLLGGRYRERLATVFDRADLVHCVSRELADRAVELGLEPAKLFVRPWGVDTARFRPLPTRSRADVLRVVSVGRLHWVKGYEFALQAIARARRAGVDVEYTVIGAGDRRNRLNVLTTARDLDLLPCLRLRGALSQTEVADTLREADVFLLASLSEGLSNATLEAMAVGLPVLVTDVGGMREAVTDGVEGRVVPPRDPAAMAAALLELAADDDLRSRMGRRARERAARDFETEPAARAMMGEYERLVHDWRAPAGTTEK